MRRFISEICSELGIHPQTLRNWESRGLITPKRDWAGRRIFSDGDFEKIKSIIQERKNHRTTWGA
jgi:MerR family transcriptional regulator, copper efflux regulator